MDRMALLTAVALAAIATVGGGAAFRLVVLLGSPVAATAVVAVAALVGAALVVGTRRRPRQWTPYW